MDDEEARARDSAESDRFRALADHAIELVAEFDSHGRYLYASPSYRTLLGIDPADLVGTVPLDLIHPEDLNSSRLRFADAVDGEQESLSTHRLRHTDGTWRWFENSGRAYRTAKGELRFVSLGRDITVRRQAEEALNRRLAAEKRLLELSRHLLSLGTRELAESFEDALSVAGDIAGSDRAYLVAIPAGNEGNLEVYGSAEAGAPGVDFQRLPWLEAEVRAGRLVRCGGLGDLPEAAARDREELEARGVGRLLGVPLRAGDQNLGMLVFEGRRPGQAWTVEEITLLNLCADVFASSITRLQTETELGDSRLQLVQAQKMDAVGRLAGGIAHDFNNLLMVIGGFSASLTEQLADAPAAQADAREIADAVARASKLTEQLLTLSRRQVVEAQRVDLNVTIAGLREILRRLLGEDIALEVESEAELPAVRVDPGQFEQALVNLAMNARNAMSAGGILHVSTRTQALDAAAATRVGLSGAGRFVVVTVRDSGSGMDTATQARVFEPFFTTRKHGQGTGLGLSIVYGLVHQWNGAITLWSRSGQGTTFRIYLPAVEGQPAPRPPGSAPKAAPGSETVLVAEDETPVRNLLCRILRQHGYQVLEAADGIDAIEKAAAHDGAIDLLLTDVVMPRMGGVALARQLRGARPDLRVLFCSGHPEERTGGAERDVIAGAFLQKPCMPAELLAKLRDIFDEGAQGSQG